MANEYLAGATSLVDWMHQDDEMAAVFSLRKLVSRWIQVEVALAQAQAACGLIPQHAAESIARLETDAQIDLEDLRRQAQVVGYPILPLLRQLDSALPEDDRGFLHLGATTQDIMDTALALQLRDAGRVLDQRIGLFGGALASLTSAHRDSVMPGRTHAQHAVPTTFGVKCAAFLTELIRHRVQIVAVSERVSCVSLFGAAGTSAAAGPQSRAVRRRVGELLGLKVTDSPWHVTRDVIASFVTASALVASTAARFAQEVIDLSRTEIGELSEAWSYHRGASSTMPQKVNAVQCEACVGIADVAAAAAAGAFHMMRAGHERAAGQWHAEWKLVPEAVISASAALELGGQISTGLRVHTERMRQNLSGDLNLVMSEAYMMALAGGLGRERAHDVVYEAANVARREQISIEQALEKSVPGIRDAIPSWPIRPEEYLGEAQMIADEAVAGWQQGI